MSTSFSLSLTTKLDEASGNKPVVNEIKKRMAEAPDKATKNDIVGPMFHELFDLRKEVEPLRQQAKAGFDFTGLGLDTSPNADYDGKSESDLILSAFLRNGGLDTARVKKALIAQAKRDYTAANPGNDRERSSYLDVQDRLEAALRLMIEVNTNAKHWYLREMINSKSLSINACANIPTVQTFIRAHQEEINSHNADFCVNDKGKQSPYFNRQSARGAKEAGVVSVKRVCCTKAENGKITGIEARDVDL